MPAIAEQTRTLAAALTADPVQGRGLGGGVQLRRMTSSAHASASTST
jgi:hypothetical protein